MSEKIALIGSGSRYAEEIHAILNDSMIFFKNPHASRKKKEIFTLRGRHKETHPWDNVHLSKAERKGKTYEQMQELRARTAARAIFEAAAITNYLAFGWLCSLAAVAEGRRSVSSR